MKNEESPHESEEKLNRTVSWLRKGLPSSLGLYKGKEDHRKEKTGDTQATSWGCNMTTTSQVDDGGLH